MKSPKEDYEIHKSVDLGTREDLVNLFSFYTLVIYHVIISRSNKCTSIIDIDIFQLNNLLCSPLHALALPSFSFAFSTNTLDKINKTTFNLFISFKLYYLYLQFSKGLSMESQMTF